MNLKSGSFRTFCCIFFLLILLSQSAGAQSIEPGGYAAFMEGGASESGLEIRTNTTLEWNGLPLLDEQTNSALHSLANALVFQTKSQGADGDGYISFDMLLQGESVLDFSMVALDGVYYEQSNLLGGQTVAFTKEDFATFAKRISEQSGGILHENLGVIFDVALLALGGMDTVTIEMDTLDGVLSIFNAWQAEALQPTERLRPDVYIPGIYGARSEVMTITREEANSLVSALSDLLSDDESLWEGTVRNQFAEDESQVRAMLENINDMLNTLPKAISDLLPETMEPIEFSRIYGYDGLLVSNQLKVLIPDTMSFMAEWLPAQQGIPTLFFSLSADTLTLSAMISVENGTPTQSATATQTQNRQIAEFKLSDGETRIDLMMTHTENIETQSDKESVRSNTEWMITSDALLGEGALITLSVKSTDATSGEGLAYKRQKDTGFYLKGMGFDEHEILTTHNRITAENKSMFFDAETDIVCPALLDEDLFSLWLNNVQVSFVQVGYTCLGRLPTDVAAYVLERYMQ